VTAIPFLTSAVDFPQDTSTTGAVVRHLLSQAVHLRDVAQHALRDHSLSPDVIWNRFALAVGLDTSVVSNGPISASDTQ
jgi:hypothetical protein